MRTPTTSHCLVFFILGSGLLHRLILTIVIACSQIYFIGLHKYKIAPQKWCFIMSYEGYLKATPLLPVSAEAPPPRLGLMRTHASAHARAETHMSSNRGCGQPPVGSHYLLHSSKIQLMCVSVCLPTRNYLDQNSFSIRFPSQNIKQLCTERFNSISVCLCRIHQTAQHSVKCVDLSRNPSIVRFPVTTHMIGAPWVLASN